jgi:hypothetical protein
MMLFSQISSKEFDNKSKQNNETRISHFYTIKKDSEPLAKNIGWEENSQRLPYEEPKTAENLANYNAMWDKAEKKSDQEKMYKINKADFSDAVGDLFVFLVYFASISAFGGAILFLMGEFSKGPENKEHGGVNRMKDSQDPGQNGPYH